MHSQKQNIYIKIVRIPTQVSVEVLNKTRRKKPRVLYLTLENAITSEKSMLLNPFRGEGTYKTHRI